MSDEPQLMATKLLMIDDCGSDPANWLLSSTCPPATTADLDSLFSSGMLLKLLGVLSILSEIR